MVLDLPKNYSTVKEILEKLNVEGIEYMTQADMKLLMILVGKFAGRPSMGAHFVMPAILLKLRVSFTA